MVDSPAVAHWRQVPRGADGFPYPRYERDPSDGAGPGVILMHELFGVTARVAWLGDAFVDAGFTVWIPELFEPPLHSVGGTARFVRGCVTREFAIFSRDRRRGVASPLGDLARLLNAQTPGDSVGIVGMCFTGGFALAAAAVPGSPISAAVASQPALPFPTIRREAARNDPGLSGEELGALAAREGFCALGLRFVDDGLSSAGRFAALHAALGGAFEVIPLPSDGSDVRYPRLAHSVLTPGPRELPRDPADRASAESELASVRDRVIAFLRTRLDADVTRTERG